MPIKGFSTASVCVLFERTVAFEQLDGALTGFEIVKRIPPEVTNPVVGGPKPIIAFRPDINGYVAVDTVDKPWPDHIGDPKTPAMLFGAWATGHLGPFTFPKGLK